jgi:GTP cyclohydrolase I
MGETAETDDAPSKDNLLTVGELNDRTDLSSTPQRVSTASAVWAR